MGKKREESVVMEDEKTSKKQRRIERKKNKIKAFLEVAKANDEDDKLQRQTHANRGSDEEETSKVVVPSLRKKRKHELKLSADVNETSEVAKKTSTLTPEEELKKLKAECIERKRRKMQQPLIYLTDIGVKAKFHHDPTFVTEPLSVTDIQKLFLMSLYGGFVEYHPNWCRFIRWAKCSHRVVVLVEGASVDDYRKHIKRMKKSQTIFDLMVEVSGSVKYFDGIVQELLWITMTSNGMKTIVREHNGSVKTSGKLPSDSIDVKVKNDTEKKRVREKVRGNEKFTRLDLLLSPKQMLIENYPFVPITQGEGWMDFEFTKDSYLPVKEDSPLFAIDCEMCITTAGTSELTRVSIVDEKLDVIYDTLVKPDNEITNYLTRYSGITASLLKDVKVRLPDVQAKIKELLPADAILCGQSLNCDMHALKMVHPYVIDTSVIFNLTGMRRHKSGLKLLSQIFLKEKIQTKSNGHDPIEDSISVMKLVLLKLSKGIDFGDVILYEGDADAGPLKEAIVSRGTDEKQKKIAIISGADKARSSQFQTKKNPIKDFCVDVVEAVDNEDVVLQTQQRAIGNDITIARLNASEGGKSSKNFFSELDDQLSLIFDSCASNALVVIVFGDASVGDDMSAAENGLCMIRLKLDVT